MKHFYYKHYSDVNTRLNDVSDTVGGVDKQIEMLTMSQKVEFQRRKEAEAKMATTAAAAAAVAAAADNASSLKSSSSASTSSPSMSTNASAAAAEVAAVSRKVDLLWTIVTNVNTQLSGRSSHIFFFFLVPFVCLFDLRWLLT
jgi:hypothetical protein